MIRNTTLCQFFGVSLFLLLVHACGQESTLPPERPNILLIVADDLGYGDISCYGGDIETPNIDALANHGIRFTRFKTAPMCAPTRAMLLSGNDNHIAGMGLQGEVTDSIGYEGHLTNRIIPIPALLRDTGYHTSIAGKWHLGLRPEDGPQQKGFDRSFVLLNGAGNHYDGQSVLRSGSSNYRADGETITWPQGAYSTDLYTDSIISYITESQQQNKPFFTFAAYTSPHWPLQVDTSHWHKFRGRYDEGYEVLRKQRLASLKDAGMIPSESPLPPLHPSVMPWDSLSEKEQQFEARKMELYAGMVDNLDYNIGRLIAHLKSTGAYENTMVIFMSDNGAAYRDFINTIKVLRAHFNDDYDRMGLPDSYISYGPQWAEAGSAPFRYFKDYASEGGINTTLIISNPNLLRKQSIDHSLVTVQDLAPTFYEWAGTSYPNQYLGKAVYPLRGASMASLIKGEATYVHDSTYVFAMEHSGNAMVRKGKWKLTNHKRPFKESNFALYDVSKDLAEQTDLKNINPQKYNEMISAWKKFKAEVGVIFPKPR